MGGEGEPVSIDKQMNKKRAFSRNEKTAVQLVTGASGEADHIIPYSAGGKTTVENCQMLSGSANKAKGAFYFQPRKWQKEFLRKWEEREPNTPFMLIAIPGCGKTMASLEACRKWVSAAADRKIIVVVPTDNLRTQWKKEAFRFGIQLQTKEFGTEFNSDFQGGVATYHLVANQPLVFRKLCSVYPIMVVFDEIHHCGDEAHFGRGITSAFELAKERLCLSGTPWKSDGTQIPYVRYDSDGYAIGDFSYDYPRALVEDVVRYLVFDHSKGGITNESTGVTDYLSKEISDKDAAFRLRKILSPKGDYVEGLIRSAHSKLIECRKSIPDAAALAACIDVNHALGVADTIRNATGCEPSVIVSDSESANDTIEDFKNSSKEWLVAVRQVSEGTDIKRLQVLCYLTNTTSELFFRQLVGRVSRVRGIEDFEAYAYLPADPRLIRNAENIKNAQVQALREQNENQARELEGEPKQTGLFDQYSTTYDGTEVVLIGNNYVPLLEAQEIKRISEQTGVSMQKVMQIRELSNNPQQHPFVQSPTQERPIEDIKDGLRKKCNKAAFRLSKLLDVDVSKVHIRYKRQIEMSEQELRAKLQSLTDECRRVK